MEWLQDSSNSSTAYRFSRSSVPEVDFPSAVQPAPGQISTLQYCPNLLAGNSARPNTVMPTLPPCMLPTGAKPVLWGGLSYPYLGPQSLGSLERHGLFPPRSWWSLAPLGIFVASRGPIHGSRTAGPVTSWVTCSSSGPQEMNRMDHEDLPSSIVPNRTSQAGGS